MTADVLTYPTTFEKEIRLREREAWNKRYPKPGTWFVNEDGQKTYRFWRLDDLAGYRPHRHPEEINYGVRGKVLLALGQVWVEYHNDKLWVVNTLTLRPDGKYNVLLTVYKNSEMVRLVSESTLRSKMEIWEEAVAARKELAKSLQKIVARQGGGSDLFTFFGLDLLTGNRID